MPGVNLPFQYKAEIGSDQKDQGWYETGLVQRTGGESRRSQIFGAAYMEIFKAELGHPPGIDHVVEAGKGSAVSYRPLAERSPWIFMSAPDKATCNIQILPGPSQGRTKAVELIR